jgi:hypothetical protein
MTDARARVAALLDRLSRALLAPKDPAALAVFRVLFGALGFVSCLRFQMYGWVDELFVKPRFHFSYWGFSWVQPVGPEGMRAIFAALTVASACVAAGFLYRPAIIAFFIGFSYIHLIDVTNYLNHYYLVSLLALVMAFMPLHAAWSIDAILFRGVRRDALPAFCTYLLRFQVGLVYTFAGVAKISEDWLLHAQPLNIWLSSRTELPLVGPLLGERWVAFTMSWAGCLFDLSIAWLLLARRTRLFAYGLVLVFHAVTKLLFPIGMFPAIMVVSALVFFSPSWPRRFLPKLPKPSREAPNADPPAAAPSWLRPAMVAAGAYLAVQLLAPLRAHAYGGNVHWHEQGMRFSWRVMVREKNASVTYRVLYPETGRVVEVSPRAYLTDRQEREFSTQPDMILKLAHHIAEEHAARAGTPVTITADVVASLNGRRAARLIDPTIDLAAVPDSLAPALWIQPAPTTRPPALRSPRWNIAASDAAR